MKKYLPYVIFGVPALIGVLFIIKSIRSKNKPQSETPIDETNDTPQTPTGNTSVEKMPFKKGMKGETIKSIQIKLGGLTVDGDFGRLTEAKVKEFQRSNGLVADGIVGKLTWKALFGVDYPNTSLGGSARNPITNYTTKFPVDNSNLGI
jgi:peptidoglycan hydrolase-like protein with peptidoglycan-binding domain